MGGCDAETQYTRDRLATDSGFHADLVPGRCHLTATCPSLMPFCTLHKTVHTGFLVRLSNVV